METASHLAPLDRIRSPEDPMIRIFRSASAATFLFLALVCTPLVPAQQEAPPPYLQQVRELMGKSRWKDAFSVIQPHIGEIQTNPEMLHLAGQLLLRIRRFEEAFPYLMQAHQLRPDNPAYLFDMASCRFNQGQFKESLGYWRQLESLADPRIGQLQQSVIAYNRGVCARQIDLIPEAIEALNRAIGLAPNASLEEKHRFELAGIFIEQGKFDLAARELERLTRLNPSRWEYHYYLGLAKTKLGKLDEAENHLAFARRLAPREWRITVQMGNVFMKRKDYDQAEGYYLQAIEQNPLADEALRNLGTINRTRGDEETAAEYFKRYKDAEEKGSTITEELRTLRRQIISSPRNIAAHKRRIEILLRYDRKEEAMDALSQLIAVAPDLDWALLNMSFLLARQGRYQDAVYELDKILDRNAMHPFANRDMGRLKLIMRRPAEAIPYLQRALDAFTKQEGDNRQALAGVHEMLATAYGAVRDAKRAEFHRSRAEALKGKAR